MGRGSRILFMTGVSIHLTLVVAHNLLAIASGMYAVYGSPLLPCAIKQKLQISLSNPIVNQYSIFTGIQMGYGFYAPHVGSPYAAVSECLYRDGRRDTVLHAGLNTGIGIMRFSSALDVFQRVELVADTASARPVMRLAWHLAAGYAAHSGAESVRCHIVRLQPPGIRRPEAGTRWRRVCTFSNVNRNL